MVKNRGGENGMIFPGGENGISPTDHSRPIMDFSPVRCADHLPLDRFTENKLLAQFR